MCLRSSATGSGLPLLPWHYSPLPPAASLLWSPKSPLSLPLFLPLRSAPVPWLPLPLADCYAVYS